MNSREARHLLRQIAHGKDAKVVPEYEVNTGLIEALNSVEKRAAIETGQEVDRQEINLRGKVNDQADVLRKTFTFEELRVMQDRMQAVIDAEQSKPVTPANIIDVKPILEADDRHESTARDVASGAGKRPSWRY